MWIATKFSSERASHARFSAVSSAARMSLANKTVSSLHSACAVERAWIAAPQLACPIRAFPRKYCALILSLEWPEARRPSADSQLAAASSHFSLFSWQLARLM
eukprot:scaffold29441_cov33-Tisochrysis_lutea.AAC.4